MNFEPIVRSAQTMHISCAKNSTISSRTELNFHLSLVTYEYHRVRPKQFLSLCYVWHELCPYLAPTLTLSQNGQNEISHDARHLGVASGASKMIFEPMVCLAQTVHLSCLMICNISKQTEMSFHLSLTT
jgi:hypothetical protein